MARSSFTTPHKLFLIAGALLLTGGYSAHAQSVDDDYIEPPPPPTLPALEILKEGDQLYLEDEEFEMPYNIRKEALKEAALSYGARGGLSRRIYEIRQELKIRARYLDKVFDFAQLLIPAPSGFLIEPPVISKSENAMLIEGSGQEAAVSDRIYNIDTNAKIVSAARNWRTYLERSWGETELPPQILLPQNDEERVTWLEYVNKGWELGYEQANDIFEEDLHTLVNDYEGMVRYRILLSQGMVSAPYALQVDRGITGGGTEMRIGDRAVQITGVPQLITGFEGWQPASR